MKRTDDITIINIETAILNTAKANILNLIKNQKQNKYLLIIFVQFFIIFNNFLFWLNIKETEEQSTVPFTI